MRIRPEAVTDHQAVRRITEAAYETPAEANLIESLRSQASPIISLVAEDQGAVVGHILFTPVTLDSDDTIKAMGLAPMAVAPDRQRGGIGTALVEAGLDACRDLGAHVCVVLGHPEFYPRFGFEPSVKYGIRSEYDVPDDVFMVLELQPGALRSKSGMVRYHTCFATL